MDAAHMKKAGDFMKFSGGVSKSYQKWHKDVFDEKNSPLDAKTMELIALAASSAVKCSYCIESHSMKARKLGATPEEIVKAVQIASVVGAGSVVSYGVESLEGE